MSIRNRFRGTTPVSQWIGASSGGIKSVQRGTITIAGGASSNTATISAVDASRARVRWLGQTSSLDQNDGAYGRVTLTDATTVTATRGSNPAVTLVIGYEVVEYLAGAIKSVQRGTIVANADPTDATIAAVNTAKTEVDYLGFSFNSTGEELTIHPRLSLLNATTVRANVVTTGAIVGYQVVEWA
jgi:hypothetical protein